MVVYILYQVFLGLGAPHWNQFSTGLIIGLTGGTKKGHNARAALEALVLQSMEVVETMSLDSNIEIKELRVDGGASANDLLMQIQSDIAELKVIRPKIIETTAQGVAFMAGLHIGYWESIEEIQSLWTAEKKFIPEKMNLHSIKQNWKKAVQRAKSWVEKENI
tara:strand:+ start:476 stop:964 length:489 start_codon:yes stop_codon:yes gene_type:complete